ncbi:MAG: hypothetical protein AAFR11_01805 [Pseudomonadota bacterium]
MDPRFLSLAFSLGLIAGVWGERLAGGAVERALFQPRPAAAAAPAPKPKIITVQKGPEATAAGICGPQDAAD